MMWYDMMIYLTAIGLKPGGSSTVHIYTQTTHRTTQSTQTIYRTTQSLIKQRAECASFFVRYKYALCLTTEEKARINSDRLAGERQLAKNIQNKAYTSIRIDTHNNIQSASPCYIVICVLSWHYRIFTHYLIYGMILGKSLLCTKCVRYSLQLCLKYFSS
jgi:hypothetical protein